MVDVGGKAQTRRLAMAEGFISMGETAFDMLREGSHTKGDVLAVARVAGITATKKTSELVPLCHPVRLSKAQVTFEMLESTHQVRCQSVVEAVDRTGVEMEALTAVHISLLTIYDMTKSIAKNMPITNIHLLKKTGGKSGEWICPAS